MIGATARHNAIGYVVKRYPRFSETFIVNEILAHEAAGLDVEIFALLPPSDTHFQDGIARVRAPLTYLPSEGIKASEFWTILKETSALLPQTWAAFASLDGEEVRDVWQGVALAGHVAARGIRHLHAHFATAPTMVARLAARLAGISYSFTAHAKDIYGPEVRHDDMRRKLMDAAGTITVSEYNLAYLRATYGASAARVRRVYNGLPLEDFPFTSPRDRAPCILTAGRLVEKKGVSDLIDACALLDRAGRAFECEVIGSGPLEGELRQQIARLGLTARVRLLGPRPRAEVARHMRGAAVFVAPCVISADGDRDGLPTVLLEAMATGTPCVSTAVTGIPEILRPSETGLIVDEHSPEQLASAIDTLLADEALRVRLATNARALIDTSFDASRNAQQIREVFSAAISRQTAIAQEVA